MTKDTRAIDILIGTSIYLSTLYFSSNSILLITLGLLAYDSSTKNTLSKFFNHPELLFVLGFSFLAYINILTHVNQFDWNKHSSSLAVILVVFSAILAPNIRISAIRIFIAYVCIEVIIACFEYIFEIQLSPVKQANITSNEDLDLLYNKRAFGLSDNSSLLATKIFISIILASSTPNLFFRYNNPALIILTLGLYITFNRTAIICALFYFSISNISIQITLRHIILGAAIGLLIITSWDAILLQFMRGNISELSGSELQRIDFLQTAIEFISENFFFGNGSLTFRVEDTVYEKAQHLHNSFLMLLVTHGTIISSLLLFYIGSSIKPTNKKEVCAFLFFSLTQYFVFWNLSMADIILFWLLGKDKTIKKINTKTIQHQQIIPNIKF